MLRRWSWLFLSLLLFPGRAPAAEFTPVVSATNTASFKELTDYVLSYQDTAEAGDAQSQYNLGAAYRWGVGIGQNLELGVLWIRRSAVQGYAPAERVLGSLYENGEGVRRDNIEAFRWYRRAARHGDTLAERAIPRVKAKLPPEELVYPSRH